jgi:hypothetical protein
MNVRFLSYHPEISLTGIPINNEPNIPKQVAIWIKAP